MKKIFSAVFALAMVVLMTAFASAYDVNAGFSSLSSMYQDQTQSLTVNISNSGPATYSTNATMDLSEFTQKSWSSGTFSLAPSTSKVFTVTLTTDKDTDVGSQPLVLVLSASNSTYNETSRPSVSMEVLYPYCDNVSNMTKNPLYIDEIKNEDKLDDKDFHLLDTMDIRVKVGNSNKDDSYPGVVQAVLVQGSHVYSDDDAKKKINIKEDSSATFNLNLTVPSDMDAGQAYIYIMAYNDDESTNCEQKAIPINIKKSSRDLTVYSLDYPSTVTCGDTFNVEGSLYNIGKDDEDKVDLQLKAFGQYQSDERSNFNSGDEFVFSFPVAVPLNATQGPNKMTLKASFNYDSDNNDYGDYTDFDYTVTVANCKKVAAMTVQTETSTALASTDSEVRFLLSNSGATTQTFMVSGTTDWATISSITPQTLVLNAGDQQYVSVHLTPNKDATVGSHNLALKVSYGSTTETVNVPVSLQKATAPTGLMGQLAYQFKYNTLWAVLDTVLILAIVVILVLIFTSKRK